MRLLLQSISRKEWRFVFFLALLTVIITSVPYLYGYLTTPRNMAYTGIHHLTPGDTNAYLSMIEQVKQGHNIFLNLYTSEPQTRVYINPFYLAVGWLARVFNLPNLLSLHLARIISILAFIPIVYLLICYLFSDTRKRKWVLAIVLFSSGLGIFLNPFLFDVNNIYQHPTDIWVGESITFLTLYHFPHVVASLTLIVAIFLLMMLAFEYNEKIYSLWAGMACFFLAWFHPFNIVTIYVVVAVYMLILFLWQRKIIWSFIKHYIALLIIPLPVFLYLFLINRYEWVINQWNAQNVLPSPSAGMYAIGYGLILLFAIIGAWRVMRQPTRQSLFLLAWAVSSALLLYAPIYFQRRLSEGLHVPLAILAAVGIFFILERLPEKNNKISLGRYAFIAALLIFLPLTNIQILGQDIYLYKTEKTLPYYLYKDEVAAMYWLKDNTDLRSVVFSAFNSGNFIPAYSGRVVWIGHGPQTADLEAKKALSEWFWQDDGEAEQKYAFLKENNITYVYYGRYEAGLGGYYPSAKSYLKNVFSNDRAEIYEVL